MFSTPQERPAAPFGRRANTAAHNESTSSHSVTAGDGKPGARELNSAAIKTAVAPAADRSEAAASPRRTPLCLTIAASTAATPSSGAPLVK